MKNRFVILSFLICIAACIGDILVSSILGSYYPGYNHLRDTLSQMGSDISPVAQMMSIWWIVLGSMFVFLGISFGKSFFKPNKYVTIASWLIVFYGIGESICSGVFPVNYNENGFDLISLLHIILSGLGVLSIMILPLVLQRIFTKKDFPSFYRYSYLAVALGLLFISLFSLAKSIDNPQNFFVQYKGLWQRLLSLNFYCYLISLVILMLKYRSKKIL